jgi:hypothetical protein
MPSSIQRSITFVIAWNHCARITLATGKEYMHNDSSPVEYTSSPGIESPDREKHAATSLECHLAKDLKLYSTR